MEQRKEREVGRNKWGDGVGVTVFEMSVCVYSNWHTGYYTKKARAKMDF